MSRLPSLLIFSFLLLPLGVLIVACASPENAAIQETVIVQVSTIVQVTRIVEVTRIVDFPVTTTPLPTPKTTYTPSPTMTPRATNTPRPSPTPSLGTRGNPYPAGRDAYLTMGDQYQFAFTVLEIVRGDAALQRIKAANQFNDPPPSGFEFVLIRINVRNLSDPDSDVLELGKSDMAIVTQGRIIRWRDTIGYTPCCLEPDFDFSLLSGGFGEGWLALPIDIQDQNPLLLLGDTIYFLLTDSRS